MADAVLYEVKNRTAYITINKPEKRNCVDHDAPKRIVGRCSVIAGVSPPPNPPPSRGSGMLLPPPSKRRGMLLPPP